MAQGDNSDITTEAKAIVKPIGCVQARPILRVADEQERMVARDGKRNDE